jgi:hypothetical protein
VNCKVCQCRFTVFVRRHHCRSCGGEAVCGACSPHKNNNGTRCCSACFSIR